MADAELGPGQEIAADDAVPDRLSASLREHGQCLQGALLRVVCCHHETLTTSTAYHSNT